MIKRTYTRPAHILPFQEWVEKTYPEKTPSRTLLRLIGALDLAYLVYRLQAEKAEKVKKVDKVVKVTKVKKVDKVAKVKKVAKVSKKPAPAAPEVEVEFHTDIEEPVRQHKEKPEDRPEPEPLTLERSEPDAQPESKPVHTPEPEIQLPAPEPEPLELEQTAPEIRVETKPEPVADLVWLDDKRLEEQDLRRTKFSMGVDGIPVSFRTRDIDDERETLLKVNGISYVASLSSPSLNLSQMLQIARVDYGELYVLGRMALGAISGEGYITAEEAARIIRALNTAGRKPIDMEIEYYAKDKTARSRSAATMRIRFEPI